MKIAYLKTAAMTVLVSFLSNSILPPGWSAPAAEIFSKDSARSFFELTVPENLASIESLRAGTEGQPAVVHIQTAHGNFEAQKKIQKLLHYLDQRYGIKTLFVEGSPFDLKPKALQFAPDDVQKNRAINEELARRAIVKGPELFLLEARKAKAYGIEELEVYKANGEAFKSVLEAQEKTGRFVKDMDLQIKKLQGVLLQKKLRLLLERHAALEEGRLDLGSWLHDLNGYAKQHLKLDFREAAHQIEWPMLVRYFKIIQWEKEMDLSALEREQTLFLAAIQSFPRFQEIKTLIQGSSRIFQTAQQLESLAEALAAWLPRDFDYRAYPNVNRKIGIRLLQSEIQAGSLMAEAERLSETVFQKLALGQDERKVLQIVKEYRALQKLFRLELTPSDYEFILKRVEEVKPSAMASRFQALSAKSRVRAADFKHLAELDSLYAKALEFYRLAKKRDTVMLRRLLQQMREKKIQKAAVITGGFHAGPFEERLQKEGISYALLSPKLIQPFQAAEKQAYIDAIFENDRPLQKATYETPTIALNRSELRLLHNLPWLKRQIVSAVETVGGPSLRSETRTVKSQRPNFHRQVERELKQINGLLYQFPDGEVSEFSRIQALLAALRGGSAQVHIERLQKEPKSKAHPVWKKETYSFRWGLYALLKAKDGEPIAVDSAQKTKIAQAIRETLRQLQGLGIRPGINIPALSGDDEISIGSILTDAPEFQNEFFHTFLGETKPGVPASAAQSRIERVFDLLKLTSAEKNYLKSFDNIFIPVLKLGDTQPFVIRAQHKNVRGPYKGGIRLVFAKTLEDDPHFMKLFNHLKQHLTLQELRYFLRKYVYEETLPLSFGMTSKTAVAGLPYGGAKGTMLAADVYLDENGVPVIRSNAKDGDLSHYLHSLARGFARELAQSGTVSEKKDIPAADLNSARFMDVMGDTHSGVQFESFLRNENGTVRRHLKPEDLKFLADLSAISPNTSDALFKPYYLQVIAGYMADLRKAKRPTPKKLKALTDAIAAYTSKSLGVFGSLGRPESTGVGGIHVLEEGVKLEAGESLQGKTAKLMGFGGVGIPAAEEMIRKGMKLEFISVGPLGGVKKTGGFSLKDLEILKKVWVETQGFSQLNKKPNYSIEGAEYLSKEQMEESKVDEGQGFLGYPADVFVLAAVENSIHLDNVPQAQAKIYLELANGAITNEAYDRLLASGATVYPDTLANAGGVIVSYLEWLQNLENKTRTYDDVIQEMKTMLSAGMARVDRVRQEFQTDWRTAADVLMTREVLEARRKQMETQKRKRSETRQRKELPEEFKILSREINEALTRLPAELRQHHHRVILQTDDESTNSAWRNFLPEGWGSESRKIELVNRIQQNGFVEELHQSRPHLGNRGIDYEYYYFIHPETNPFPFHKFFEHLEELFNRNEMIDESDSEVWKLQDSTAWKKLKAKHIQSRSEARTKEALSSDLQAQKAAIDAAVDREVPKFFGITPEEIVMKNHWVSVLKRIAFPAESGAVRTEIFWLRYKWKMLLGSIAFTFLTTMAVHSFWGVPHWLIGFLINAGSMTLFYTAIFKAASRWFLRVEDDTIGIFIFYRLARSFLLIGKNADLEKASQMYLAHTGMFLNYDNPIPAYSLIHTYELSKQLKRDGRGRRLIEGIYKDFQRRSGVVELTGTLDLFTLTMGMSQAMEYSETETPLEVIEAVSEQYSGQIADLFGQGEMFSQAAGLDFDLLFSLSRTQKMQALMLAGYVYARGRQMGYSRDKVWDHAPLILRTIAENPDESERQVFGRIKTALGRSEVREESAEQQAINRAHELKVYSRARAEEMLRFRDDLLTLFRAWSGLKKEKRTDEAARMLESSIRTFADNLDFYQRRIRLEEEETVSSKTVLDEIETLQSMPEASAQEKQQKFDRLKQKSQKLYEEIGRLQSLFEAAAAAKDSIRLEALNRQASGLHKARLKIQLLQTMLALQMEKPGETVVQVLLTAVRDSYLRLSEEYAWRWRRAVARGAAEKVWVLGRDAREVNIHAYPVFRIFENEANHNVTIRSNRWQRQTPETPGNAYVSKPKDIVYADLKTAERSQLHTMESQEEDYQQVLYQINAIEYLIELYKNYPQGIPEVLKSNVEKTFDELLNAPQGGLASPYVRVPQKREAAAEIRAAMTQFEEGKTSEPIGRLSKTLDLLNHRLRDIEKYAQGVMARTDHLIHRIRKEETRRAAEEIEKLFTDKKYSDIEQLTALLLETHYQALAVREDQYRSLKYALTQIRFNAARLKEESASELAGKNIQAYLGQVKLMTIAPRRSEIRITREFALKFAEKIRYMSALGRPLSGKGTLMKWFMQEINRHLPQDKQYVMIVVGDLFRGVKAIVTGKATPEQKAEFQWIVDQKLVPDSALTLMKEGKLVPDPVVVEMLNRVLEAPYYKNAYGIFFDGFPRTPGQLETLNAGQLMIRGEALNMDLNFILDVEARIILDRARQRREEAAVNGEEPREDDQAETVERRLKEYDEKTSLMVESKRGQEDTIQMDGYVPNASAAESKQRVREDFMIQVQQFLGDLPEIQSENWWAQEILGKVLTHKPDSGLDYSYQLQFFNPADPHLYFPHQELGEAVARMLAGKTYSKKQLEKISEKLFADHNHDYSDDSPFYFLSKPTADIIHRELILPYFELGAGAGSQRSEVREEIDLKFSDSFSAKNRSVMWIGDGNTELRPLAAYLINELNGYLSLKKDDGQAFYQLLSLDEWILGIEKAAEGKLASAQKARFAALAQNFGGIAKKLRAGEAVASADMILFVNKILEQPEFMRAEGVFFDGFPKTSEQIKWIEEGKIFFKGKPLKTDLYILADSSAGNETSSELISKLRQTLSEFHKADGSMLLIPIRDKSKGDILQDVIVQKLSEWMDQKEYQALIGDSLQLIMDNASILLDAVGKEPSETKRGALQAAAEGLLEAYRVAVKMQAGSFVRAKPGKPHGYDYAHGVFYMPSPGDSDANPKRIARAIVGAAHYLIRYNEKRRAIDQSLPESERFQKLAALKSGLRELYNASMTDADLKFIAPTAVRQGHEIKTFMLAELAEKAKFDAMVLEALGGDLSAEELAKRRTHMEQEALAIHRELVRKGDAEPNIGNDLIRAKTIFASIVLKKGLPALKDAWLFYANAFNQIFRETDKEKRDSLLRDRISDLINLYAEVYPQKIGQSSTSMLGAEDRITLAQLIVDGLTLYFNSPTPGRGGNFVGRDWLIQAVRSLNQKEDKVWYFRDSRIHSRVKDEDFLNDIANGLKGAKISGRAAQAIAETAVAAAASETDAAVDKALEALVAATDTKQGATLLLTASGAGQHAVALITDQSGRASSSESSAVSKAGAAIGSQAGASITVKGYAPPVEFVADYGLKPGVLVQPMLDEALSDSGKSLDFFIKSFPSSWRNLFTRVLGVKEQDGSSQALEEWILYVRFLYDFNEKKDKPGLISQKWTRFGKNIGTFSDQKLNGYHTLLKKSGPSKLSNDDLRAILFVTMVLYAHLRKASSDAEADKILETLSEALESLSEKRKYIFFSYAAVLLNHLFVTYREQKRALETKSSAVEEMDDEGSPAVKAAGSGNGLPDEFGKSAEGKPSGKGFLGGLGSLFGRRSAPESASGAGPAKVEFWQEPTFPKQNNLNDFLLRVKEVGPRLVRAFEIGEEQSAIEDLMRILIAANPQVGEADFTKAYRALAFAIHPDKQSEPILKSVISEMFDAVTQLNNILTDSGWQEMDQIKQKIVTLIEKEKEYESKGGKLETVKVESPKLQGPGAGLAEEDRELLRQIVAGQQATVTAIEKLTQVLEQAVAAGVLGAAGAVSKPKEGLLLADTRTAVENMKADIDSVYFNILGEKKKVPALFERWAQLQVSPKYTAAFAMSVGPMKQNEFDASRGVLYPLLSSAEDAEVPGYAAVKTQLQKILIAGEPLETEAQTVLAEAGKVFVQIKEKLTEISRESAAFKQHLDNIENMFPIAPEVPAGTSEKRSEVRNHNPFVNGPDARKRLEALIRLRQGAWKSIEDALRDRQLPNEKPLPLPKKKTDIPAGSAKRQAAEKLEASMTNEYKQFIAMAASAADSDDPEVLEAIQELFKNLGPKEEVPKTPVSSEATAAAPSAGESAEAVPPAPAVSLKDVLGEKIAQEYEKFTAGWKMFLESMFADLSEEEVADDPNSENAELTVYDQERIITDLNSRLARNARYYDSVEDFFKEAALIVHRYKGQAGFTAEAVGLMNKTVAEAMKQDEAKKEQREEEEEKSPIHHEIKEDELDQYMNAVIKPLRIGKIRRQVTWKERNETDGSIDQYTWTFGPRRPEDNSRQMNLLIAQLDYMRSRIGEYEDLDKFDQPIWRKVHEASALLENMRSIVRSKPKLNKNSQGRNERANELKEIRTMEKKLSFWSELWPHMRNWVFEAYVLGAPSMKDLDKAIKVFQIEIAATAAASGGKDEQTDKKEPEKLAWIEVVAAKRADLIRQELEKMLQGASLNQAAVQNFLNTVSQILQEERERRPGDQRYFKRIAQIILYVVQQNRQKINDQVKRHIERSIKTNFRKVLLQDPGSIESLDAYHPKWLKPPKGLPKAVIDYNEFRSAAHERLTRELMLRARLVGKEVDGWAARPEKDVDYGTQAQWEMGQVLQRTAKYAAKFGMDEKKLVLAVRDQMELYIREVIVRARSGKITQEQFTLYQKTLPALLQAFDFNRGTISAFNSEKGVSEATDLTMLLERERNRLPAPESASGKSAVDDDYLATVLQDIHPGKQGAHVPDSEKSGILQTKPPVEEQKKKIVEKLNELNGDVEGGIIVSEDELNQKLDEVKGLASLAGIPLALQWMLQKTKEGVVRLSIEDRFSRIRAKFKDNTPAARMQARQREIAAERAAELFMGEGGTREAVDAEAKKIYSAGEPVAVNSVLAGVLEKAIGLNPTRLQAQMQTEQGRKTLSSFLILVRERMRSEVRFEEVLQDYVPHEILTVEKKYDNIEIGLQDPAKTHKIILTVLPRELDASLEAYKGFKVLVHKSLFSKFPQREGLGLTFSKYGQTLWQNPAGEIFRNSEVDISHVQLERFEPLKPFESFTEEKEFYRFRARSSRVFGWQDAPVESVARPAFNALMEIPFLYSSAWAHSSAPSDHAHANWGGWRHTDNNIDWKAGLMGESSFIETYAQRNHTGFITFRTDESHPDFLRFKSEMEALGDIDFIPASFDPSMTVFRVKIPQAIIDLDQRDPYQAWVEAKWKQVEEIALRFSSPTDRSEVRNSQEDDDPVVWEMTEIEDRMEAAHKLQELWRSLGQNEWIAVYNIGQQRFWVEFPGVQGKSRLKKAKEARRQLDRILETKKLPSNRLLMIGAAGVSILDGNVMEGRQYVEGNKKNPAEVKPAFKYDPPSWWLRESGRRQATLLRHTFNEESYPEIFDEMDAVLHYFFTLPGRSEARGKKKSEPVKAAEGNPTVNLLQELLIELDNSGVGYPEKDNIERYLKEAIEKIKREGETPQVISSAATALNLAANEIKSIHTRTIDALHEKLTQSARRLKPPAKKSPFLKPKGDTGKTGKRSEVRTFDNMAPVEAPYQIVSVNQILDRLNLSKPVTRILIAEDDEDLQLIYKSRIRKMGLQDSVQFFADGQEVWEYLEPLENRSGLLLVTDWNMPKMDGGELSEKVRGLDLNLPILVSSNGVYQERLNNISHSLQLNKIKFLSPEIFQEVIRAVLAGRSENRSSVAPHIRKVWDNYFNDIMNSEIILRQNRNFILTLRSGEEKEIEFDGLRGVFKFPGYDKAHWLTNENDSNLYALFSQTLMQKISFRADEFVLEAYEMPHRGIDLKIGDTVHGFLVYHAVDPSRLAGMIRGIWEIEAYNSPNGWKLRIGADEGSLREVEFSQPARIRELILRAVETKSRRSESREKTPPFEKLQKSAHTLMMELSALGTAPKRPMEKIELLWQKTQELLSALNQMAQKAHNNPRKQTVQDMSKQAKEIFRTAARIIFTDQHQINQHAVPLRKYASEFDGLMKTGMDAPQMVSNTAAEETAIVIGGATALEILENIRKQIIQLRDDVKLWMVEKQERVSEGLKVERVFETEKAKQIVAVREAIQKASEKFEPGMRGKIKTSVLGPLEKISALAQQNLLAAYFSHRPDELPREEDKLVRFLQAHEQEEPGVKIERRATGSNNLIDRIENYFREFSHFDFDGPVKDAQITEFEKVSSTGNGPAITVRMLAAYRNDYGFDHEKMTEAMDSLLKRFLSARLKMTEFKDAKDRKVMLQVRFVYDAPAVYEAMKKDNFDILYFTDGFLRVARKMEPDRKAEWEKFWSREDVLSRVADTGRLNNLMRLARVLERVIVKNRSEVRLLPAEEIVIKEYRGGVLPWGMFLSLQRSGREVLQGMLSQWLGANAYAQAEKPAALQTRFAEQKIIFTPSLLEANAGLRSKLYFEKAWFEQLAENPRALYLFLNAVEPQQQKPYAAVYLPEKERGAFLERLTKMLESKDAAGGGELEAVQRLKTKLSAGQLLDVRLLPAEQSELEALNQAARLEKEGAVIWHAGQTLQTEKPADDLNVHFSSGQTSSGDMPLVVLAALLSRRLGEQTAQQNLLQPELLKEQVVKFLAKVLPEFRLENGWIRPFDLEALASRMAAQQYISTQA